MPSLPAYPRAQPKHVTQVTQARWPFPHPALPLRLARAPASYIGFQHDGHNRGPVDSSCV
jgi:hypothetical protein